MTDQTHDSSPARSGEPVLDSMERLRRTLTPGDLDHTLRQIVHAAVEVLPRVDRASITVRHDDGRLETAQPSDDDLLTLDVAQYELREGPCYEAATDTVHAIAPDLATDPRFPRYARVALEHGVRAQAGLRLFDTPRSQGALNLYSRETGAFADLDELGDLFVHQAGTAVAYAQEVDDLRTALEARRTIGQAVGILMERYELTDERAFAFLTRLSSHRNVKLRRVAEEVVEETEERARPEPT
ncbi:MAG TPA: GAF and ANTAR domain-containing protein [Nocardioides sp.]|nr:GAF and ANTAR domain-containing protein [Nocardioides sp.]